jgi:geranylgeranyl pyrophosphate synthase
MRLTMYWHLASQAQTKTLPLAQTSLEHYFTTSVTKTGMTFALSAWAGAQAVPDFPAWITEDIYQYGLNVGLKDQIIDDTFDLAEDLRQGVWTLPLLYTMQNAQPAQQRFLVRVTQNSRITDEQQIEAILSLVHELNGIPLSLAMAAHYQQEAINALTGIPDRAKKHLIDYASQLITTPIAN